MWELTETHSAPRPASALALSLLTSRLDMEISQSARTVQTTDPPCLPVAPKTTSVFWPRNPIPTALRTWGGTTNTFVLDGHVSRKPGKDVLDVRRARSGLDFRKVKQEVEGELQELSRPFSYNMPLRLLSYSKPMHCRFPQDCKTNLRGNVLKAESRKLARLIDANNICLVPPRRWQYHALQILLLRLIFCFGPPNMQQQIVPKIPKVLYAC